MDVEMYERAVERTGEVVRNTRSDQLGDSTPCSDWDVRALINHIIGGMNATSAGGSGDKVEMDTGVDLAADDHVGAYERASKSALETFSEPGSLERTFTMPWGDTPGSAVLGLVLSDCVVHGWDLAQATGQHITIDDDVAEAIYGMTAKMMKPKGSFPRGDRFAQPVEVADDAPPADRMIAYFGRRP